MFVELEHVQPTLGCEANLAAHLVAQATADAARGRGVSVGQQLYALDGPAFVVARRYASLAELERSHHADAGDPAVQETLTRTLALGRSAPRTELWEEMVSRQEHTRAGFMTWLRYFPNPASIPVLTGRLVEEVVAGQGAGLRKAISTQLFSPHGGLLAIGQWFVDFAEVEALRTDKRAHDGVWERHGETLALCRAPLLVELFALLFVADA